MKIKELRLRLVASVLPQHENPSEDKHVESKLIPRLDESSNLSSSTYEDFLEHKPALLINNDLIVDFLKDLFENKALARKSIEKYQQILFSFFNYLIDKKKINMHNPVLNISRIGIIKDEAAAAIPAR